MSAAHESRTEGSESVETRKVRITRLDPWSVAKSAFMLGLTIAGVLIVATVALWLLLSAAGVFEAITGLFQSVSGNSNSSGVSFLSLGRLVGLSMVISAIEIVLLSVLSVIFAVLYNLSVGFTGGIEVSVTDSGTK
ncbi:MAG: DUF3566 domain-containing protein [Actinobacteria bacterium]|nr:DUF3566 domain-containing protein [Actinomycetota bacterium]